MKILHVITRLILGGAQQNTVMCSRAQAEAGHDVHLAYGPIYGPEGSLLEDAQASGASLHELSALRRSISPWHDWRTSRQIQQLIREIRPDIVHTHSSKAGILGRFAAWKVKTSSSTGGESSSTPQLPIVLHTVHGLPFHDHQPRWLHDLYVRLERASARRCDGLIAITPQMTQAFVDAAICPADRFDVVPSGVSLDAFVPKPGARARIRERYGFAHNAEVVGLVARLDRLKGQMDLLDVTDAIRKARSGSASGGDVRVLLVGDGFDRPRLEAHPEVQSGRAVITGLIPLDEIADHLAAMDVKVLPSYQEGQSRTLIEALAAGVPVVGYDVGGIPAIIRHERTGLLVPVGETDALRDAILRLLGDRSLAIRLVEQGRTHVQQHFSAETMTEQLQAIYDRFLEQDGSN